MKNVYSIQLVSPVETSHTGAYFTGKSSSTLFVVASSFEAASEATRKKYPSTEIRSMSLLNYSGIPIVIGE